MECNEYTSLACPLTDCGRSGIAHKDLKVHWQQECQQVSLTCTACGFVARRPAMQSHFKCSELDKKERAEDKELIQKLVQNNEMLVKEISQLKQQLQTQHLEESKEKPRTTNNQSKINSILKGKRTIGKNAVKGVLGTVSVPNMPTLT